MHQLPEGVMESLVALAIVALNAIVLFMLLRDREAEHTLFKMVSSGDARQTWWLMQNNEPTDTPKQTEHRRPLATRCFRCNARYDGELTVHVRVGAEPELRLSGGWVLGPDGILCPRCATRC